MYQHLRRLLTADNCLNALLVFLPVCAFLELTHSSPVPVFVTSCLAIIPLAGWMGKATEHLAERTGAAVGGLLNATFGNAAELIIAVLALQKGLYGVVKASITGSIIGNILLVLGLSILAGGIRYPRQKFNRTAASMGSTLLALSVTGLLIPAVFHMVAEERIRSGTLSPAREAALEQSLSLEICIVLFVVYLLSLVFSLITHRDVLGGLDRHSEAEAEVHHAWSFPKSIVILVLATAGVAVVSEVLVGAVEATAHRLGLSQVFVGVIVVAVVGNAAEHSTAVLMAAKNKMDLAINIAVGSSIQVALFVAPLLVFVSYLLGSPMDLRFTSFEVLSVATSVGVVNLVAQDAESNWMEGVLLLAVYLILGIAFYFLPV
ncbi:MAG: calcium/proton exchanger [Acidobacteriota bacterium]